MISAFQKSAFQNNGFQIDTGGVAPPKVGLVSGGKTTPRYHARKRWWEQIKEDLARKYPIEAPSPAKKAVAARKQVQELVEEAFDDGLLKEANAKAAAELAELAAKTRAAKRATDTLRYTQLIHEHIARLKADQDDEETALFMLGII